MPNNTVNNLVLYKGIDVNLDLLNKLEILKNKRKCKINVADIFYDIRLYYI